MRTICVFCLVALAASSMVFGQDEGESNALDLRTRKAIQVFIKDGMEIAIEYEKNGDLQKAKNMYEQIQRLDNRITGVDAKIEFLDQQLVAANQQVHMLDTSKGWVSIGMAYKGRKFRVLTAGTYTMTLKQEPNAMGFENGDVKKNGMDPEFPLGSLIGAYYTGKKPGKPFLIGKEDTLVPEKDGILYLKVNVPPVIACEGIINIGTSGWFNLPPNSAPSITPK
ncbi:MAG: hypothetical protein ACJZ8Y_17380 [Pirellulaceae bacterium]